MRVGIVTSYASKHPAGLERFLIDLLRALSASANIDYVVYTRKGAGLSGVLRENGILNINVIEVGFGMFWKHLGLFFAPRVDAYLFNGPVVPLWFAPKNYFVILQDFAYKYIPPRTIREKIKGIIMDMLTRKAVRRAKKIITVSDATKRELLNFFGGNQDKIVTIYPGFKRICSIKSEAISIIKEPYFLCVGTLKERKNIISVVMAFAKYKKERKDSRALVIVGKQSAANQYFEKLRKIIDQEDISKNVIFTGHISDAQVSYLYQNAEALVFPSLLEGFGMPPLEAMSCGVPVITSNAGSLAEVSGDAAIHVDPLNIDEILEAMKRIVDDKELRRKLVSNGLNRSNMFHWSKTARELEDLLMQDSV